MNPENDHDREPTLSPPARWVITLALIATVTVGIPGWLDRARGFIQRRGASDFDRERTEHGLLLNSIIEGVAATTPAAPDIRVSLLLLAAPSADGESAQLVYRTRSRLLPRQVDVLYPCGSGGFRQLDLDYRPHRPTDPFPDLASALRDVTWLVAVGGFRLVPDGFERRTPAGAFGYGLYRRVLQKAGER